MALTFSTQAQIAYKNLSGKSHTDTLKDVVNESEGISFNIISKNIWLDTISPTSSLSVVQGSCVLVIADLTTIASSNGHSYTTNWPSTPPSGSDVKTGLPFSYGVGSLINVSAGSRLTNIISDSYGSSYQAKPYVSYPSTSIPLLDSRVWVYQYNSGIFYQDITTYSAPTKIAVYAYIGSDLSLLSASSNQVNIRLTALGTDSYYATSSNPTIATYSSNYLYLVDFQNSNIGGSVSINIDNIGTASIIKFGQSGPVPLNAGDIIGATGGTAGSIYYLTYNNGSFQFFKSNPVQAPSSYNNPIVTLNKVGGIEKGTSFNNVSVQDLVSDLMYPEQLGNISSFIMSTSSQIGSFEVGDSVNPGTYSFSWILSNTASFIDNSSILEDISLGTFSNSWQYIGTIGTSSNNGSFSYFMSATVSSSYPRNRDYRFSIYRNNNTLISSTFSIPFMWKAYYGSSTYSSLTASGVVSLGGTLSNQSIGNWSIIGSGYKYIAFPDNLNYVVNNITYAGMPVSMTSYTDGYTFSQGNVNYSLVSVTNSHGVMANYKIYRTQNLITGTFSVSIN